MRKMKPDKIQAAQGMVEFALVLPVLLILILGIFAFGHLFFAYSSVVSASREAARWGAAVGVADSMRPRYRDCPAIRGQAVRVGSFAGVEAVDGPDDPDVPGIYVGYDHGPNDPDPAFDDCADDNGPSDIGYGDRIVVRVTVNYRPVVPFVNIPEFPLSATSARTIIRSLPVGEAPLAEPACRSTVIVMEIIPVPAPPVLPASPVVGQPVDIGLLVTATNGTFPPGVVYVNDEMGHACEINVPGESLCNLVPLGAYTTVGTHYITARFDADTGGPDCYRDSEILLEPVDVIRADSIVEITSDEPDPSWPGDPVLVQYNVRADNPGAGTPVGGIVTVSDNAGHTCSSTIDMFGDGECTLYPTTDTNLVATYSGDPNFEPSIPSLPEPHRMQRDPTAEPSVEPTEPTEEPLPTDETCPTILEDTFSSVPNGGQVTISNLNGTATSITRVSLTWPLSEPAAELRELRLGPAGTIGSCIKTGGPETRNCLWQFNDPFHGLPPPSTILPTAYSKGWDNQSSGILAGTEEVFMLLFTAAPPSGPYTLTIAFENSCVVSLNTTYTP